MTPKTKPIIIRLGNRAPVHQYPALAMVNNEIVQTGWIGRPAQHLQQTTTVIQMRPGFNDAEHVDLTLSTDNDRALSNIATVLGDDHRLQAIGVHEIEQLWPTHCHAGKPAWIDGTDNALVDALASYYGIPKGEPTNLLVNAGRDAIASQIMSTGAQPAAANYVALTATTTAPAVSDTTLAGEIATASGGLIRAQATFAHTNGTNTSTLTKTFTANGSDTLPVTIAQIGVFNASTVGTLFFHTALSGTATLSVVGDNVTITETVTAG